MNTIRLENSSLEEQRRKAYGQEMDHLENTEMQRKRTREDEMQKTKNQTRDCSQKAGRCKRDGNKEDMTTLAWNMQREEMQRNKSTKMQRRSKIKFKFKKEGRKPSKWKIK